MRRVIAILAPLLAGACSEANTESLSGTACTPPLAGWPSPHPHLGPGAATYHISLDRDGLVYLNGVRSTPARLPAQLDEIRRLRLRPDPVFILETEMGVSCERLDAVRSIMNRHLQCDRGGHCDEGVQRIWQNLPSTGAIP